MPVTMICTFHVGPTGHKSRDTRWILFRINETSFLYEFRNESIVTTRRATVSIIASIQCDGADNAAEPHEPTLIGAKMTPALPCNMSPNCAAIIVAFVPIIGSWPDNVKVCCSHKYSQCQPQYTQRTCQHSRYNLGKVHGPAGKIAVLCAKVCPLRHSTCSISGNGRQRTE